MFLSTVCYLGCLQLLSVSGTVISGCQGGHTTYLTPGVDYTIYCFVNNTDAPGNFSVLEWSFSTGCTLPVTLYSPAHTCTCTSGNFTADDFSGDNMERVINSSLSFTANVTMDDTTISCQNLLGDTDTCTLLVYTRPNGTLNLTATNITYQSVALTWIAPIDTGGYTSVNYIITVTPLNNDNSWNITTDDSITSYIVTGLMFGTTYNFTVRANNSIGQGEPSNTVTVTLPAAEVPPQLTDIEICLDYTDSTNPTITISLVSPSIDATTTPPVTNYSLFLNMMDPVTIDVTYYTLTNGVNDYTVNITANNIVGSSKPISDTFNARLLQYVSNFTVTNTSFTIQYTTVDCLENSENYYVQLIYSNTTSTMSYVPSTTDSFILTSLQPSSTTVYYTLQVFNTANVPVSNSIVSSVVLTLLTTSSTTLGTTILTPTTTSTSTPTSSPTSSPTPSPTPTGQTVPIGAIAGGAAAGGIIVVIILIGFGIILVVYFKKKKSQTKVNFDGYGRDDPDGPIALVNRKEPVSETGQPTYQDPNTMQQQEAPTGDLYAMPDKPNKSRREAPSKPEAATYQDPSTIQRQEAPTGNLYALPAQKPVYSQVNKDRQQPGIMYAELGFNNAGSTTDQLRGAHQEVLYSDAQTKM